VILRQLTDQERELLSLSLIPRAATARPRVADRQVIKRDGLQGPDRNLLA
jgi:hypothetical protein